MLVTYKIICIDIYTNKFIKCVSTVKSPQAVASSLCDSIFADLLRIFGAITEINLHAAINITIVEVAVYVHVEYLPFKQVMF